MANQNHHAGEEIRITNVDPVIKEKLIKLAKNHGTGKCLGQYLKIKLRTIVEDEEKIELDKLNKLTNH